MSSNMTDLFPQPEPLGDSFGSLIEPFVSYLRRNGRSASTEAKYRHALELFAAMSGRRGPALVSATELDEWLRRWHAEYTSVRRRPPSAATYRNHVSALRSYYAYLE